MNVFFPWIRNAERRWHHRPGKSVNFDSESGGIWTLHERSGYLQCVNFACELKTLESTVLVESLYAGPFCESWTCTVVEASH